jgi:hypothetical protein
MTASTSMTSPALRTARSLAHALGHGWACDDVGPTDAEILGLGIPAAVAAWESRLQALDDADPDGGHEFLRWRGLIPSLEHRSGSGTVRWVVTPTGAVAITVSSSSHWHPQCPEPGEVLWTLSVSPDRTQVTGGMTRGASWPAGDHERCCAELICRALGVPMGWLNPVVAPLPRPLVTEGAIRRF